MRRLLRESSPRRDARTRTRQLWCPTLETLQELAVGWGGKSELLSASGKVVISMVTRQYRRPYLRSPYIREQLEQPKQELADAMGLIDQFRDRVSTAYEALTELTEDDSNPDVERRAVRAVVKNDRDSDVPAS